MGITEATVSSQSKLCVDLFQEVFKHNEPEVQIDSYEEEQGCGRGDNYTAILYRIHLNGHRKGTGDVKKQKWEKNIICKRLPESVKLREAYKSDKLFRNEVEFYTTIMPELLKFQASKTDQVFAAIPKCFYARDDLLIMEDLRVRGFRMPDRKKGLSIDETEAVLKQVAQFHALTLSYKYENRKQFEALCNLTSEGLFAMANESWYRNYYSILTRNAVKMVCDVLPEDSKYVAKIKEFADSATFFERMVNMLQQNSPLSALCHGDCWANNFLYRYEYNGDDEDLKVAEMCLVDFQMIRYCSIALDVANILYCCCSKAMRDNHLAALIKVYTGEAFKWLQCLCLSLPESFDTLEKFEKLFSHEMQQYGSFALGIALDIIPISTCSSEDAPDMTTTTSATTSTPSQRADEIELGAPELNLPPNDMCRQKMTDIVVDMVDRGLL